MRECVSLASDQSTIKRVCVCVCEIMADNAAATTTLPPHANVASACIQSTHSHILLSAKKKKFQNFPWSVNTAELANPLHYVLKLRSTGDHGA